MSLESYMFLCCGGCPAVLPEASPTIALSHVVSSDCHSVSVAVHVCALLSVYL